MSPDKTPLELAAERITDHNIRLRTFLLRLLDPDDLGHAVTEEVRSLSRELVKTPRPHHPQEVPHGR